MKYKIKAGYNEVVKLRCRDIESICENKCGVEVTVAPDEPYGMFLELFPSKLIHYEAEGRKGFVVLPLGQEHPTEEEVAMVILDDIMQTRLDLM